MPFDPFFSSANKKHYVPNPEFAALKAKVLAMSRTEREVWCAAVWAKPYEKRSFTEIKVLSALRFQWGVAAHTRRRWQAERLACDLSGLAAKHGATVFHGHSTTGATMSQRQAHPQKSAIHPTGEKRHFDRIYRRKAKKKSA